ncbi:MAG TPA: acetate--CoA ligase family protein, partial [Candidatus Acidoferrum sp.]|nr:acetate--CoA ligase family protein [Candidatus Acidoferrum sp.]
PALEILAGAGVPMYRSLEASAKAMAACWRASAQSRRAAASRRSSPDRGRVDTILARATATTPRLLLEPDARELLAAYGIAVPAFRVAATADETEHAARELGGRLAIKLVAPELLHKSEAGGVLLDVAPELAAEAYRELVTRAADLGIAAARVLLTPMVAHGLEMAVGAFRDAQFGPVVMFGLGGTAVEALADVAFRLAPVDEVEARAMLGEFRAHRLLGALRGRGPRDTDAAVDVIVRVSELVADLDEIAELDLNPVFLLERGIAVADARAVLGPR